MTRIKQSRLSHQVVEFIPEHLDDGVLYISHKYKTASHKCCCGCGEEVVTPLGPTDWSIQMEGGGVTLYPSIGNWSYACRSHYWIRRGQVVWAGAMSQRDIERGRDADRVAKRAYFESVNRGKNARPTGFLQALWAWLSRWWN